MVNPSLITNDAMLMQIIGEDMKAVIDDMSQWVVERIQDSIFKNVYSYPETDTYHRLGFDGGFIGAWAKEITEFVGNYISNSISMVPSMMEYNPDEHQHGNSVEDRREIMDDIVMRGREYDFGGAASVPRDYWSEIEAAINSGEFDNQLEKIMTMHGILFMRS
jgi:hypothetical protein